MAFRDALISAAAAQWTWFGKDTGRDDHYVDAAGKTTGAKKTGGVANRLKETVEPYSSRVADYWLAINSADYNKLVRDHAKAKGKLDGTIDLAWSAAFISYCMQMAGAGAAFPYAPGHATWIVKSIANRQAGKLRAALVGYKPGEIALQPGDLIGRPRETGITYANAVAKGWFIAHTDIVVDLDRAAGIAHVIGGNVGQTVSKSEVAISANGGLVATDRWFVHIQNNIPGPNPAAVAVPTADARVG